ncbi:TlpA family protein disulfide reductase [Flavitalea flava]
MKTLLLIVFSLICVGCSQAQNNNPSYYPEVGKPCPEFELKNIKYYPKRKASLKDFRGKWLLLDFWNRVCGACVASFPHVNEIQKNLGERVQVMMVGIEDPNKQVEIIYSRYRAKEDLLMPCAFDSAIAQRFDFLITPRSILIDDKGVVQCITTTIHLNEMKAFLAGEHPVLPKAFRMNETPPESISSNSTKIIPFDYDKPFAINGNGGVDSDFLFRSILTTWKPGVNGILDYGSIDAALLVNVKSGFSVLGADLRSLYFYAYLGTSYSFPEEPYYGKYSPKLFLEVTDSSMFKVDYKTGKNLFCYSVNLPPSKISVERVKEVMQKELENSFGFFVSVEDKKCPCWKLIATKEGREKVKTKGGAVVDEIIGSVLYKGVNMPFENVFKLISRAAGDNYVIDESGINGNVDMTLECGNCVLTDINDMKKILHPMGLDLVPTEKEMKVLVVRDRISLVSRDQTF